MARSRASFLNSFARQPIHAEKDIRHVLIPPSQPAY
jgi:hypothetical protein